MLICPYDNKRQNNYLSALIVISNVGCANPDKNNHFLIKFNNVITQFLLRIRGSQDLKVNMFCVICVDGIWENQSKNNHVEIRKLVVIAKLST